MRWICPRSEMLRTACSSLPELLVFLRTETEGLVWIFHAIVNCNQMVEEREENWVSFRNLINILSVLIQGQFVFPGHWFSYAFTDLSPEKIHMQSMHYRRWILFLIRLNLPTFSPCFTFISLWHEFLMLRSGGHNTLLKTSMPHFCAVTSHRCLLQEDVAGTFWAHLGFIF